MQIQTALWHNQHTLLERLVEARRAMQEGVENLSAEELRSALMSFKRNDTSWQKERQTQSPSSDNEPRTPDMYPASDAALSKLSTPLVSSSSASSKKSGEGNPALIPLSNFVMTVLNTLEPTPPAQPATVLRPWPRSSWGSPPESTPIFTPPAGDSGDEDDTECCCPKVKPLKFAQFPSPPSAWKQQRIKGTTPRGSPRKSIPGMDYIPSPRSVRSLQTDFEQVIVAPDTSMRTALWLICSTLVVILIILADARVRPGHGMFNLVEPKEPVQRHQTFGAKQAAAFGSMPHDPMGPVPPSCAAPRGHTLAQRAMAMSPLGIFLSGDSI